MATKRYRDDPIPTATKFEERLGMSPFRLGIEAGCGFLVVLTAWSVCIGILAYLLLHK